MGKMSDAEWDADDYEPQTSTLDTKPKTDKWEGEDEDDDVKDSWDKESDDEDTSKGSEDSNSIKAVQRKKKKKLHENIAEQEALALNSELFGVKSSGGSGIDAMVPETS